MHNCPDLKHLLSSLEKLMLPICPLCVITKFVRDAVHIGVWTSLAFLIWNRDILRNHPDSFLSSSCTGSITGKWSFGMISNVTVCTWIPLDSSSSLSESKLPMKSDFNSYSPLTHQRNWMFFKATAITGHGRSMAPSAVLRFSIFPPRASALVLITGVQMSVWWFYPLFSLSYSSLSLFLAPFFYQSRSQIY